MLRKEPRVLVVEDEPLILMNAVDLVADAGFGVIGAKNADEAIRTLESRNDVRVVFTDIDMPGSMDGLTLAHAVRLRWPWIQFIVVSGHIKASRDDLPLGSVFFRKPYGPSQIASALMELFARDFAFKPAA